MTPPQNIWRQSSLAVSSLLFAFYRVLLAPALLFFGASPPCCRFLPTCSEYAEQAIRQHAWKGIPLAIKRLLRCRPTLFSNTKQQGIVFDPVPTELTPVVLIVVPSHSSRSQPSAKSPPCKATQKIC